MLLGGLDPRTIFFFGKKVGFAPKVQVPSKGIAEGYQVKQQLRVAPEVLKSLSRRLNIQVFYLFVFVFVFIIFIIIFYYFYFVFIFCFYFELFFFFKRKQNLSYQPTIFKK